MLYVHMHACHAVCTCICTHQIRLYIKPRMCPTIGMEASTQAKRGKYCTDKKITNNAGCSTACAWQKNIL